MRILIKNTPSKCNKRLLEYLHSNVLGLKKNDATNKMKVIIVYDTSKLKDSKVKLLPAMILGEKDPIVSTPKIIKFLNEIISKKSTSKHAKSSNTSVSTDDLQDFWNAEMHSGFDIDESNNDGNTMENVVKRAMNAGQERKANAPKPKRREVIITTSADDNIVIDSNAKIADFVQDDPIMSKFWENQEESP